MELGALDLILVVPLAHLGAPVLEMHLLPGEPSFEVLKESSTKESGMEKGYDGKEINFW